MCLHCPAAGVAACHIALRKAPTSTCQRTLPEGWCELGAPSNTCQPCYLWASALIEACRAPLHARKRWCFPPALTSAILRSALQLTMRPVRAHASREGARRACAAARGRQARHGPGVRQPKRVAASVAVVQLGVEVPHDGPPQIGSDTYDGCGRPRPGIRRC